MEKGTFISSVFGSPVEEYYLGKNSWSATASDWKQRFEVGDAIIDPAGDWDPTTAQAYIDTQIATVTSDLASEVVTRQTQVSTLNSEVVKTVTQSLTTSQKDIANANLENKDALNGMARIVLKASDNFKSVVEAQTGGNTIFVIRYDFTLTGDVTIPVNCVLEFDGGSLSGNYSLIGNKATINSDVAYNIFNDCIVKDFNLPYIDIRWFGAKVVPNLGQYPYPNSTQAIGRAIECTRYHHGLYVYICGYYYMGGGIETDLDLRLKGNTYISRAREDSIPSQQYQSATSALFIGGNVTAFTLHGRPQDSGPTRIAHICLENMTFIGSMNGSEYSSGFIYSDASGSPTRPGLIRECEFQFFNTCLNLNERPGIDTEGSIYGGLTIEQCRFINNNYIMYVPYNSNFGITNLALRDCCCEYNNIGLEIATYGNVVIDNCLFGGTEKPIQIRYAQTSYVSITNNYFENSYGTDKYAIYLYGKDLRYDKVTLLNNSYNVKIYASDVKIINSNKLTNYNYETDSKFRQCWFSGCEDIEFLKPNNISIWCLFDAKDYPTANCMDSSKGYVGSVAKNTILNKEFLLKSVTDSIPTVENTPATASALIVQHILIDAETYNDNGTKRLYQIIYADQNQATQGNSYVTLLNRGDFVLVWNAETKIGNWQNLYLTHYVNSGDTNSFIYLSDFMIYKDGYQSEDRLYNFPAFFAKPYGSTRPSQPSVGMSFFDTSINKMVYWSGNTSLGDNGWVDANGNSPQANS